MLIILLAVCVAPHRIEVLNLLTPVRSQARRERSTPVVPVDGVGMNRCSVVVVNAPNLAEGSGGEFPSVVVERPNARVVVCRHRAGGVMPASTASWSTGV